MNKSEFIEELAKQTGFDKEKCNLINEIIEDTFIIGRKNKDKMLEKFKNTLNLDEKKADELYNTAMNILGTEIKNKLKNPFKSQD